MQHQNNLNTMVCDLIVISLVCAVFIEELSLQKFKYHCFGNILYKIQYDFQVAFNLKHPSCTIETPLGHP